MGMWEGHVRLECSTLLRSRIGSAASAHTTHLEAARRVVKAAVDHPRATSAGVMLGVALCLQHRHTVPQGRQSAGGRQANHA